MAQTLAPKGGGRLDRLAKFIDADIIVSKQVRRRNVLKELTNPCHVDLYFVLDGDHRLNMRLQIPIVDLDRESEEEPLAVLFDFAL